MTASTATPELNPTNPIDQPVRWRDQAACRSMPADLWFPAELRDPVTDEPLGRYVDGDNHGRRAKAICAGCPVLEACLLEEVSSNAEFGCRGGAGGRRRRALRQAWLAGSERWAQVFAAHRRDLRRERPLPGDRGLLAPVGAGVTHGRRATQAKGCGCWLCRLEAGVQGVGARRREAA